MAQEPKTFGERIVIFEFERSEDMADEEYAKVIADISTRVFTSNIERAPLTGQAIFVPRDESVDPARGELAEDIGAEHYISGQFRFLRGNLLITAQWFDLERGRQADAQALLGRDEMEDFGIVERKVQDFAQVLLDNHMKSRAAGDAPGERMWVTCFSAKSEYLRSFFTLELPAQLEASLRRRGVSPQRLAVEGFRPSEYRRVCQGGESREQEARYELSGTIVEEGERIFAKTLLFDAARRSSVSIDGVEQQVSRGKDLSVLTSELANHLAERLRNILVQQRLVEEGFDPGTIDGFFGRKSVHALEQYQAAHDLPHTGLSQETLKQLGF